MLSESKDRINAIREKLCDIEDNSGLKKYGYKPFAEQYSIDTIDDNVFVDDNNGSEVVQNRADDYTNEENTLSTKELSKELTKKANLSEERTTQTVHFAQDMPFSAKKLQTNDWPKPEPKPNENSGQNVTKKYDKLLARTPQPQDFGITRRYNFLPSIYDKTEAKNTPEEPNFDTTQTCRFNYINNGFNLGTAIEPMATPPNQSSHNSNADSFITVEFTPGLTTKRPKGISRVNANNNHKTYDNHNNKGKDLKPVEESFKRLPQSVLQSVENDKITPEQPIPSADSSKTAHILRSIGGKGSGTPPLPKSRVDPNLHKQILKHL